MRQILRQWQNKIRIMVWEILPHSSPTKKRKKKNSLWIIIYEEQTVTRSFVRLFVTTYEIIWDLLALSCLNLSTDISFVRLFGRTYENNLWHVHKLFSTYFHKFSKKVYENNFWLTGKQFNFIKEFFIKKAYT